jgi:tetratricopeptide (TPR) repeat protein
LELLNEAIFLIPEMPRLRPSGNTYIDLGQPVRAIQDFDQAIRLDSKIAFAYVGRGSVYTDLGQSERALRDFDQAIRLAPDYALAYVGRGLFYFNLGQYEKAIQDYSRAINLNLRLASVYRLRAQLMRE